MLRRATLLRAATASTTVLAIYSNSASRSHSTLAQSPSPTTLFSLSGRTALVTGGSQGLGKAIARGLALAGADVIIASRREPELRSALAEITAGTSAVGDYIVADLGRDGEAERLGSEALRRSRSGRVDILISNAGISRPGTVHTGLSEPKIKPLDDADFDATCALAT